MKRVNNLSKRRKNTCFYCNVTLLPGTPPGTPMPQQGRTIDHIIPRCKGGMNVQPNKVFACWRCNSTKANEMPHKQFLDEIGFVEREDGWFYGCIQVSQTREVAD